MNLADSAGPRVHGAREVVDGRAPADAGRST